MSLRFIFMLMYTPLAMVTGLRKPFWGLVALVAMYYFRPDIWDAPPWFRPVNWITVSVGIGWLSNLRSFKFDGLMGLAIWVVVAALGGSFLAAGDVNTAFDGAIVVAKIVVVMMLTLNLVDTPRKMNIFLWANVVGFAYNLKAIYAAGLLGGDVSQTRVDVGVGQGGGSNYIAMVLSMGVPILYSRVLNGRRWGRRFALILLPLYVVAVVLTGSRAGFISLGFVFLWLMAGSNKKVIGLLVLASLIGLFFLVVPESAIKRFKQGFASDKPKSQAVGTAEADEDRMDFSAKSRLLLWAGARKMFGEHPVFGVGMDNFPLLSPQYVGFYASRSYHAYQPGVGGKGFVTHSTWFQTLADGGLMLAIPFFMMFILVFVDLAQIRRMRGLDTPPGRWMREQALTLQAVFIAFVTSSTFGSHLKIDFLWWYFGAVGALHLMARNESMRNETARRRTLLEGRTAPAAAAAPRAPAGAR